MMRQSKHSNFYCSIWISVSSTEIGLSSFSCTENRAILISITAIKTNNNISINFIMLFLCTIFIFLSLSDKLNILRIISPYNTNPCFSRSQFYGVSAFVQINGRVIVTVPGPCPINYLSLCEYLYRKSIVTVAPKSKIVIFIPYLAITVL